MNANMNDVFITFENLIKKNNLSIFFANIFNTLKNYKFIDWLALFLFSMYSATMIIIIRNIIVDLQSKGFLGGWSDIDRFTYQSNVLIWAYMLFFIFMKKHVFLKQNKWLLSNMVYIFFTFVGYNFILVPFGNGSYNLSNVYDLVTNIWYHILCPVTYIIFGYLYFFFNKFQFPKSYWKTLPKFFIYPTIYVVYISTISFVINPEYNGGKTYTVYGDFTNLKDHLKASLPVILGMWLLFFPISYAIFYYSWKGISKYSFKDLKNNFKKFSKAKNIQYIKKTKKYI